MQMSADSYKLSYILPFSVCPLDRYSKFINLLKKEKLIDYDSAIYQAKMA